jgi:hypothetical protein
MRSFILLDKMVSKKGRKYIKINIDPDNIQSRVYKTILEKTVLNIVKILFEADNINSLNEMLEKLDSIKAFSAGIERAKQFSDTYPIAKHYNYLFTFHQYVQSSYRAGQGKVLEEILKELLETMGATIHTKTILKPPFMGRNGNGLSLVENRNFSDADVIARVDNNNNNRIDIFQLRSNTNTGGTTAKESLVKLLNEIILQRGNNSVEIFYHICTWTNTNDEQYINTLETISKSLANTISSKGKKETKEGIIEKLKKGKYSYKNITLTYSKGVKELCDKVLTNLLNKSKKEIGTNLDCIIKKIIDWDDLWISYSIASHELKIINTNNNSNIKQINIILESSSDESDDLEIAKDNFFNKISKKEFYNMNEDIDTLAMQIAKVWTSNHLPLDTPSGQIAYIKDMLYLLVIHYKYFGKPTNLY